MVADIPRVVGTRKTRLEESVKISSEDMRDSEVRSYDIVLVGTGPAGAAFVRSARRTNPDVRILAIEKGLHPREKVCGDALTFLALPLVRSLFPEISMLPTASFTRHYRLYFPNGRYIGGDDGQLDVIPRDILDHSLWSAVSGDIDTMEETVVRRLHITNGRVSGVMAVHRGKEMNIAADLVVGADGSASVVRRDVTAGQSRCTGIAIRHYVGPLATDEAGLIFLFDPDNQGYLWIFPFQSGAERWANLGYFCLSGRGVRPAERLAVMRNHPIAKAFLDGATDKTAPKTFPLNLARHRRGRMVLDRPLYGEGYVLVGDAAGLVEPHTGEGISFALHSGMVAGGMAATARPPAEWGPRYHEAVLEFAKTAYPTRELELVFRIPGTLPPWARSVYMQLLPRWLRHLR